MDEDSCVVKEFKQTIIQSVYRRWNLSELSPILGLCTVLDARFKHLKFLDPNVRSAVVNVLQTNTEMSMSESDKDPDCTMTDDIAVISQDTLSQEDSQDLENDTPVPKKVKKPRKLALDILLGPEDSNEGTLSVADEIEMYLQSKSPPRSVNVLNGGN